MANKIRKLSIGSEIKERFHYIVEESKAVYNATINGKQDRFSLVAIEETENHFLLYLKSGDEVHLWKKEPKNEFTAIEYFLD
jgi:hypothetical protein